MGRGLPNVVVLCLCLAAAAVFAGPEDFQVGEVYPQAILTLHPTQFSVGMRIVNERQEMFERLTRGEKRDFIRKKKHRVPVVVGRGGVLYMVDRHHQVRMLWQAGEENVHVEVMANWHDVPTAEFWNRMTAAGWVYLRDQFGNGPHSPEELPVDVRSLADDPYRALARKVRDEGGFEKSPKYFSEFEWAEAFRRQIPLRKVIDNFDAAVTDAMAIAKKGRCLSLASAFAP